MYILLHICLYISCMRAQLLSCVQLFCNPMGCSPPGSSVHGIFQARILKCVAISLSRVSFQPRDRTHIFCIGRQILYPWASREALAMWELRIMCLGKNLGNDYLFSPWLLMVVVPFGFARWWFGLPSQMALVVRNPLDNAGAVGSVSGSRRPPGGGHGNPLQYSCPENPMDRGAW